MFLTQVKNQLRSRSSFRHARKTEKSFTKLSTNNTCSYHVSPTMTPKNTPKTRRYLHASIGMKEVPASAQSSVKIGVTSQEKWSRLMDEFECLNQDSATSIAYPSFYTCLSKSDLQKQRFKFKVPQTVLVDEDATIQLVYASTDFLAKKPINKSQVVKFLQEGHSRLMNQLRLMNKYDSYGKTIDPTVNASAPFVVIRKQKSKGTLQVENIRNFGQNRWRATSDCVVQRYIYSRNLKAMILRVNFDRVTKNTQHQEYCVYRFQNTTTIIREKHLGLVDSHDLRAKVSPLLQRPNSFEFTKLTSPGVLQKAIPAAAEVRRMLESMTGKRVMKLSVDFVQDLAGQIWVINFRGAQFEQIVKLAKQDQWLLSTQGGYCRLCNGFFNKKQLQNSVSVRMLIQFLNHLKKRTKIEDFQLIQFSNRLALNKKQKAMSAVCECCYSLIIQELQLKKYERQLGRLCHLRIDDDMVGSKVQGDLRQWRLLVYLQDIKEVGIKQTENIIVRYSLGRSVEQKWKCSQEKGNVLINRVKVHYFFSQSPQIQAFLTGAQILVSLLLSENQKVLAQGSTGVLANFKNKFSSESGQRQTTTVLLFFESGKYCQLTLKVGLVYDGLYQAPEIPLKRFHSVLFPARDYINSNPLPREWMEMFGSRSPAQVCDRNVSELLLETCKSKHFVDKEKTKLKKKPIRYM